MNKEINFSYTRVVTKHFVSDWVQGWRNVFGGRLKAYEKKIDEAIQDVTDEMNGVHKKVKWYRLSINPLTDASIMVTIYGESE